MAEPPTLDAHGRLILSTNTPGLLAWLDPDRLVQDLEQTLPIPENGLPTGEREEQRASLSALLLTAECLEEAHVRAGRAQGIRVPRRPSFPAPLRMSRPETLTSLMPRL